MDIVEELYERIEILEKENEDLKASITCMAEDMNKVYDVLSFLLSTNDAVKQILDCKDTRFGDVLKQWASDHDVTIPHKIMIDTDTKEVRMMSKSEYDKWLSQKDNH